MALTAPIPEVESTKIASTLALLQLALSTPTKTSTIDKAWLRMSGMPSRSETDIDARLQLSILKEALTDTERNGIIPDETVTRVSQDYASGKLGKWFPSSGEFVVACKDHLKPFQRQVWELRRLQSAVVVPQISDSDRALMIAKVRNLANGFQPIPRSKGMCAAAKNELRGSQKMRADGGVPPERD